MSAGVLNVFLASLVALLLSSATSAVPSERSSSGNGAHVLEQMRTELSEPVRYAKLLNRDELADAMNYPEDALRDEDEGSVITWLLVGTDGKAERCGIQSSSGSETLDSHTCSLLISTARFEPARDENGEPIRSIVTQSLTWELDDESDPAIVADVEELKRLRAELPKWAKNAKLLNGTDVAGSMDYPKTALVRDESGTTGMLLLVGPDGIVERCAIETSSGSAALDTQSCSLFIAKARFQPASDRRGRAVASTFRQRLNWRLEDDHIELRDLVTRFVVVLGPAGEIRSCKAETITEDQWIESPWGGCDEYLAAHRIALAAARERSRVHDALVISEVWSIVTPSKFIPNVGRHPGEVLIALRSAVATYAPDGTRTTCAMEEKFGFPGNMEDLCPIEHGGLPEQTSQSSERPVETLRVVSALYLKDEPN